jgi:hypothetical protein
MGQLCAYNAGVCTYRLVGPQQTDATPRCCMSCQLYGGQKPGSGGSSGGDSGGGGGGGGGGGE